MADNISITQGSGTSIATEDVSGVQHQKVKIEFGGDGVATLVSASDPLPVSATIDTTGLATDATDTNTATIAGAVSGTEMQVDVITMPTTTVQATNLDIRDLTSTDVVTVTGGLGQAADVKVTLDGESVPVTGTFYQATQPVSLASVPSHDVTNAGTFAVQSTNQANSGVDIGDVTINNAAGASAVNIQDGGNTITVDGTVTANLAAGTNNIGDVDILSIAAGDNNIGNVDIVTMPNVTIGSALPAGTNAIGKLSANSGVDIGDVDVTSISAGTNLIGDVGIQPRTTNGLDTFMASGSDGSSILVATAQSVKASAGKVYGYYLYNPEAAVTFVHFYNTASGSVTVGTTSPLFTLQIPPASAANLISEIGITFGTAITIAATTTAGGNTAPATGVSATIWYK